MNPEELEDLLRQLVQGITQVMQSGEELSDDFQGLLAQTLGNLVSRIDEARQAQSGGNAPPIGPTTEPSSEAQLLWILSGQQEQAFISYLRNFPSETTAELLRNPAALSQTIEQLTRMMPPGQPVTVDGITHSDLNSSNIWGTAYDPRTRKMKVRFQGGSEYEYDGIPANIYRALIHGNAAATTQGSNQYGRWWRGKNPSMGAALNQYIKVGNFPYRRLR